MNDALEELILQRLHELHISVKDIQNKMDSFQERTSVLETRVETVSETVSTINTEINELNRFKAIMVFVGSICALAVTAFGKHIF